MLEGPLSYYDVLQFYNALLVQYGIYLYQKDL